MKSNSIVMDELSQGVIPVQLRLSERNYPVFVTIPFQFSGTVKNEFLERNQSQWDAQDMMQARIKSETKGQVNDEQ